MDASTLVDALLQDAPLVSCLAVGPSDQPAIYQVISPEDSLFPRLAVFENDREYTAFADDIPIRERVSFRIDIYAMENDLRAINVALHNAMRGLGFRRADQGQDDYLEELGIFAKPVFYDIMVELPLPWDM